MFGLFFYSVMFVTIIISVYHYCNSETNQYVHYITYDLCVCCLSVSFNISLKISLPKVWHWHSFCLIAFKYNICWGGIHWGLEVEFVLDRFWSSPCSPAYWRTTYVKGQWASLDKVNLFAKQMKMLGCTIRIRSFTLIINKFVNY